MTEYWVSQGNKWCDQCKIFIANNPLSIRTHEQGQWHKDNVTKRLVAIRKDNAAKEKEKEQAIKALQQIEAAKTVMGSNSGTFQLYSSTACPLQLGSSTVYWGLVLIILGASSFIAFFYATVLSKVLPPSGIPLLSAIENDRYYCLLIPLTVPVLLVLVYFHWLSMKLFKHA